MSATAIGLLTIVMWTLGNLLVVFTGDTPPFFVLGVFNLIGSLVFFGRQMHRKAKSGEQIIKGWQYPTKTYAFLFMGYGIYMLCLYVAFKMIEPLQANSLNYLWPIALTVLSFVLVKKFPPLYVIIGMVLGFLGTLSVLYPEGGYAHGHLGWGHFLAVLGGISWATYSALAKKIKYEEGIFGPVFFMLGMFFLCIHIGFESYVSPSAFEWFIIILLGIWRLSYVMWDFAMKQGDQVLLSSLAYFIPLISTCLLIAFGYAGDRPLIWLGAGMIVGGCLIVNKDNITKGVRHMRTKYGI